MAARTRTKKTRTPPATPQTHTPRASRKGWSFDWIPGTNLDEYVGPWVLSMLVIPAAGATFHRIWGTTAWKWLILVVCVAAGAALAAMAWHEAAARTDFVRARLAVSTVFGLSSLGVTTTIGYWTPGAGFLRPWADIHFWAAFVLSLSWNIPRSEAVRGSGQDAHKPADSFAEKVGLHPTTQAKVLEDDPTRMRLQVTHRWDPAKNVAGAFETIARLKGLPAAGLRIIPTDDSGVSEVELMKVDMLKHSTPWPGPSAPGESIAVPCRVGVMQDAAPMEIVRPGDHAAGRAAVHTITVGMAGTGKTKGAMNEISEMVTRRDVVIWWSDTSKAGQTTGYFRPAVDWLASTPAQTRMMVNAIDRIITKRAGLLGEHDFEQWTPEAFEILGMPYLYVGFQEASRILSDDMGQTAIVRIGEAARSVGISLDFSLQRASHSNMPTDLRSVLGSGWCFGVKEDVDAEMCLSPDTLDAGARPESWRTSKPGACYLEASHVNPTRWSIPGRTFDLAGQILRDHVAECAPRMSKLDRATAEASGTGYAEREVVTVEAWLASVRGPKRFAITRKLAPAVTARVAAPIGSSLNGGPTGAGAGTAVALLDPERGHPEHPNDPNGDEPNDDPNEPTPEELKQMAAQDAEDMTDLLDELREGDPEFGPEDLAEFMAVDPREETDPDASMGDGDVDFGDVYEPGRPLTYGERCEAFRRIVELIFHADGDPGHVDTTTEQLFNEWRQVPGNGAGGDPRPSLSRLLRKAEAAGRVEDRGRGKWRLLREVCTWDPAERVLGDSDDDPGSGDQDDAA